MFDKYDNPPIKPININSCIHKYVSPELIKYVLPYERKYVYTREADEKDEELHKIAITKDQYARV